MQKYILTLLVACICTYTNAQNSDFKMATLPKLAADTTKPIIETVPRTQANEAQATQPLGTTTRTTTTTTTTTTQPSSGYGEVYSEAIKTKEGYWVIGISPTFTEPPAGVQGSYTLGYGGSGTTTTTTAADTYTPAPTYTTPATTTYTPAPTYTNNVVSSGKMYRVQLSATKKYRAERYDKVLDLGSIVLEDTETKKGTFTRVLLDGFYTLEDARRALATIKERGNERAFIAVYDNGVRQKSIYRK